MPPFAVWRGLPTARTPYILPLLTEMDERGADFPAYASQMPQCKAKMPACGTQIPLWGTQMPQCGAQAPPCGSQMPARTAPILSSLPEAEAPRRLFLHPPRLRDRRLRQITRRRPLPGGRSRQIARHNRFFRIATGLLGGPPGILGGPPPLFVGCRPLGDPWQHASGG